jgi:hypothetical protein
MRIIDQKPIYTASLASAFYLENVTFRLYFPASFPHFTRYDDAKIRTYAMENKWRRFSKKLAIFSHMPKSQEPVYYDFEI